MAKVRMTVSIQPELAAFLRSTSNASAVVGEAVQQYRERAFQAELETAYRTDAREAARINQEWEAVDAGIDE